MKMKKMMLLMLTLMILGAASMNAQVSIGSDKAPETFSVLELINNGAQGLRLPQVDATQKSTLTTQLKALSGDQKALSKGLMVWNTTTDCMDTWDGSAWMSNCSGPLTAAIIQGPIAGRVSYYMFSYQTITLSAYGSGGSEPTSYQWYVNGEPDRDNGKLATYIFTPPTIYGERTDFTIYCEVSNSYSANIKSNEILLTVENAILGQLKEIPLRKSDGSVLIFAAQFLGQENSTQGGYAGDLYQQGRFADGHEKINSDATPIQATTLNMPYMPDNVQGKFITAAPWSNDPAQATHWTDVSNPCPSGWRIPTINEIRAVSWSSPGVQASPFVTPEWDTMRRQFRFTDGTNQLIVEYVTYRNTPPSGLWQQTAPDSNNRARFWGKQNTGGAYAEMGFNCTEASGVPAAYGGAVVNDDTNRAIQVRCVK